MYATSGQIACLWTFHTPLKFTSLLLWKFFFEGDRPVYELPYIHVLPSMPCTVFVKYA